LGLILCSDCGKEVSDRASHCNGCGGPIFDTQSTNKSIISPMNIYNDKNLDTFHEQPVKDGFHEFYHENGRLSEKGNLTGGQRHGIWHFYYDVGKLESTGRFVLGKADGLWQFHNELGLMSSKGNYKDGKQNGLWTFFDENRIEYSINFLNGIEQEAPLDRWYITLLGVIFSIIIIFGSFHGARYWEVRYKTDKLAEEILSDAGYTDYMVDGIKLPFWAAVLPEKYETVIFLKDSEGNRLTTNWTLDSKIIPILGLFLGFDIMLEISGQEQMKLIK
jgi:hypothetical protein